MDSMADIQYLFLRHCHFYKETCRILLLKYQILYEWVLIKCHLKKDSNNATF